MKSKGRRIKAACMQDEGAKSGGCLPANQARVPNPRDMEASKFDFGGCVGEDLWISSINKSGTWFPLHPHLMIRKLEPGGGNNGTN